MTAAVAYSALITLVRPTVVADAVRLGREAIRSGLSREAPRASADVGQRDAVPAATAS
jgi:hypothetical protein